MFGEGGWSYLERLTYRGFIGFFYENTLMGILTYCIIGLILIFAVIGFLAVIRFLFRGKKKGKTPECSGVKSRKILDITEFL